MPEEADTIYLLGAVVLLYLPCSSLKARSSLIVFELPLLQVPSRKMGFAVAAGRSNFPGEGGFPCHHPFCL